MQSFHPVDIIHVPLPAQDVPAEQLTAGMPRVGSVALLEVFGAEVGVWEMTEGGMRDVEADEVFIVVEGQAQVTLLVDGVETKRIELRPGVICRLEAGARTRWDVAQRLRKVYIVERETSDS